MVSELIMDNEGGKYSQSKINGDIHTIKNHIHTAKKINKAAQIHHYHLSYSVSAKS